MRRPIIMGVNPYIHDIYKKDAKALFDATGGNSGNLAFQYAIASHLRGNAPIMAWSATAAQVKAAGDVIVLPLANQLGRHTDLGTDAARLQEFGLPVIGIGLGAQADVLTEDIELSDGTRRWLNTIVQLSPTSNPNIGVRGAYTKAQIARWEGDACTVITGCPSNFINTSDIASGLEKRFGQIPRRIAVMAGIPFIPKLAKIERDLADIVTMTGGAYIVQHGLEMLQLARGEFEADPKTFELCRAYIAPQLGLGEFKIWCQRYARAFYDARAWMDYIRGFDFVVGTRFHGAMLALQAGVPAGCITHDSRTQEMCETMGIPHCRHSDIFAGITQHNIKEYFTFDANVYRAARQSLAKRYVKLFYDSEVEISPDLVKLGLDN